MILRFALDVCYVVALAFVYFVVICLLVVCFAVTGLVGFWYYCLDFVLLLVCLIVRDVVSVWIRLLLCGLVVSLAVWVVR